MSTDPLDDSTMPHPAPPDTRPHRSLDDTPAPMDTPPTLPRYRQEAAATEQTSPPPTPPRRRRGWLWGCLAGLIGLCLLAVCAGVALVLIQGGSPVDVAQLPLFAEPTETHWPTSTRAPTRTPSATPSNTPTATVTPTQTATQTPSPTPLPTATARLESHDIPEVEPLDSVGGDTRWGFGCLGAADDAILDLDCRGVAIAVENAYLPFNYESLETGLPEGWDYHAWWEICTRLHCSPIFIEAPWESMIRAVADGQFDAAADGITITEERAEIVDFSVGYLSIDQRLLVRNQENRFADMEEFAANDDLILGVQVGTIHYDTALEYLPDERIQTYEQFPIAVEALRAGEVDAVLIDEVAGQGYVGEYADELRLVGPSLDRDELGFIFPPGSDLVDPVNLALEAMMDDGTLDTLNAQFFGPGFTLTYDDIGPGVYDNEE